MHLMAGRSRASSCSRSCRAAVRDDAPRRPGRGRHQDRVAGDAFLEGDRISPYVALGQPQQAQRRPRPPHPAHGYEPPFAGSSKRLTCSFAPAPLDGGLAWPDLRRARREESTARLLLDLRLGRGKGRARTGPATTRVGQALSGLLSLLTDIQAPDIPGISVSDHVTGAFACNAVLAALYARERTGQGQKVETSLWTNLSRSWAGGSSTDACKR